MTRGDDRYRPHPSLPTSNSLRPMERSVIDSDPNRTRVGSSALLEDRIDMQHREIQSLLVDNQRLAVSHIGLKEELSIAKHELERILQAAANVKAERDAKVREVYQSSLKLEAEARVIGVLAAELDQVRADVQRLAANRDELAAELSAIDGDLAKVKPESEIAEEIKAEIESLRQEIHKGRAAIKLEKKTRAGNGHHKRVMEKNISLLDSEIMKLREELGSIENKAKAASTEAPNSNSRDVFISDPGFSASYRNPDVVHGGHHHLYSNTHQVYGTSDPHIQQHCPYNIQQL